MVIEGWTILGYSFVKRFDLVGHRYKRSGKWEAGIKKGVEGRHEFRVQGCTLVSQQGNQFGSGNVKGWCVMAIVGLRTAV